MISNTIELEEGLSPVQAGSIVSASLHSLSIEIILVLGVSYTLPPLRLSHSLLF